MDRRNFFKILSASSAALGACGGKADKAIPLLVPEHEIVPGEEQWHPAVCAGCGAGCGTVVRDHGGHSNRRAQRRRVSAAHRRDQED